MLKQLTILVAFAAAAVFARAQSCTRDSLEAVIATYFKAVETHNMSAPLTAADLRITDDPGSVRRPATGPDLAGPEEVASGFQAGGDGKRLEPRPGEPAALVRTQRLHTGKGRLTYPMSREAGGKSGWRKRRRTDSRDCVVRSSNAVWRTCRSYALEEPHSR